MSSQRTIRLPRRCLRRPLNTVGASCLAAGLVLGAWPAGGASAAPGLAEASPAGTTAPYTLTWTAADTPSAPPSLKQAAAAYDSDTASVVVFGGVTASGALSNDTWVWDGRTWSEHPAASMTQAPPARQDASMAFDPALHQLILFGGRGPNGTYLGDTWAWNGAAWYQLPPGPSGSPGARSGAAMALGPGGDLVLFGGVGAAVSGVDSTTSNPSAASPAGTGATSTRGVASAGTRVLGDTWLWTSKGWAPTSAAGPSPRWGAALAYDSTDKTAVLFSGDGAAPGASSQMAHGTWVWDGSSWASRSPTASPPPRADAVMADDPAAGGVVLATGDSGSGLLADGWIWNGREWIEARTTRESPRAGAAAAYDSAASELVVFGGAGSGGTTLGDTETVATSRPAPVSTTTTTAPPQSTTTPGGTPTTTSAPPSHGSTPVAPTTTSEPAKGRSSTVPTTSRPGTTAPSRGGGSVSVTPGPAPMALQTSQQDVRQGTTVQLAGSGFAPGSPVTITFHSTPAVVTHSVAGPRGEFTVTVAVPRTATPGTHHFVANGHTATGRTISLVASVYVLGPTAHKGASLPVKAGMLALALLIPTGAWLGMTGAGWWRRRARGRASDPRSPS